MLRLEARGENFVKAERNAALVERIGRSRKSIEFKHMNISAVMRALGRPTIRGYRPMENVQQAIFPAIERYLQRDVGVLDLEPKVEGVASAVSLFEESPPVLRGPANERERRLERLVRK